EPFLEEVAPGPVVLPPADQERLLPGTAPQARLPHHAQEPARDVGRRDPVRADVPQAPALGSRAYRADGSRLPDHRIVRAHAVADGAGVPRVQGTRPVVALARPWPTERGIRREVE